MSEAKQLLIYTAQNLTLTDAINAFVKVFNDIKEHYALLYAPHTCCLALIDKNGKATEAGSNVPLDDVFEARVFNSQAELRWLNNPDGGSDAAIVTEDDSLTFDCFTDKREETIVGRIKSFPAWESAGKTGSQKENEKEIPHGYLLWGEGTDGNKKNGWSEMATARIGAYYVPLDRVEHKERVRITAVEYLKEYEYGNVGVCEERLLKLEVA